MATTLDIKVRYRTHDPIRDEGAKVDHALGVISEKDTSHLKPGIDPNQGTRGTSMTKCVNGQEITES